MSLKLITHSHVKGTGDKRIIEGYCSNCDKPLRKAKKIWSKRGRNWGKHKYYCDECKKELFEGVKIRPVEPVVAECDLNQEDNMMLLWFIKGETQ